MQTQVIERARVKRPTGTAGVVAYAGAAAFAIGAAWFWLAAKRVTVAAAPQVGPHVTLQQGMRTYYRWQITTLPQERLYTSIAIAGFLCLAVSAVFLRDLLTRDRALARIGALTIGAGALLWTTGSVVQLGGHRAVGLMATHTKRPGRRAWARYTALVALTLLVLAGSYAAGNGNLTDLMLIADGVVLLPVWMIWSGYIGGTGHGSTTAA